MKATKILLSLAVMGTLTLGFAQTNSAINETVTAHQEAMQNAAPEDRAELMNQFKEQMADMTPQDRSAAMEQMQVNMPDGAQMQEHTQKMNMEHASEMSMEHSEEMNRAQNMNQQQAGSQLGHENEAAGGSSNMENIRASGATWIDR